MKIYGSTFFCIILNGKNVTEGLQAYILEISTQRPPIFPKKIHGIIEHSYYHLGQAVLIKKILGAS